MREATVLTCSARTHPQKTEKTFCTWQVSLALLFFPLDIKQREEIEEA